MQELTDLIEELKELDMDYLALAKDIGDQHYAALKQDPPPLPTASPMQRLREKLLASGTMSTEKFREIMGIVMEIEAQAWIRGAKDGLHE